MQMQSSPNSILAMWTGGEPAVVVGTEEGGLLLHQVRDELHSTPFGQDMSEPKLVFTAGGLLIAMSRDAGGIYRVENATVVKVAEFDPPTTDAVALLRGPRHDQFAVVEKGGKVFVMQVP